MRPCDIDRSGELWLYRLDSHKIEHHGRGRVVVLGKQAQKVVTPFLFRDPDSFLFSPMEGAERRLEGLRKTRKTKV